MQRPTSADRIALNNTAQALLRMLIGSYFVAVALNLIPGTDLGILFASVLPAPFPDVLATGLVFLLAFMVMVGMQTRLAALVLALMTFFASYLAMVSLGVADELGHFWRDLALIAALVLTYGDQSPSHWHRSDAITGRVLPRRVRPTHVPTFPEALAQRAAGRAASRGSPNARSALKGILQPADH